MTLVLPFGAGQPVSVTPAGLSDMAREARRHNLLMLLYAQVSRNRDRIKPRDAVDDFLDEMKAAYYGNVARTTRREVAESCTIDLLSGEGIPSVLLRGSTIACDLYGDPFCRTSADIDLLIRQDDMLRADAVLSGNGYRRLDRLPLTFWAKRIHHAVYHRPATDDLIEVHWNFGIPSFFRLSSEDIWADAVRIDRMQFRLSPAMTVIHLLMHHHMHSFRELRILTDIIWALHKYGDSIDWGAFAQRLTHIGLLKTAMITLGQMKMLCKERAESETALRNFREAVGKSGHGKPVMLNRYFRSIAEKDHVFQDRRDKFMARLALDIRKKMLLSFVTALFPSPGELKDLYGDNRSRMLPRHYAKFISWRMREWMPRISSQ